MIIALHAVNPETGDAASYQMGARNTNAAREVFRHFLRGRGWNEAQINAAKIEEAPSGREVAAQQGVEAVQHRDMRLPSGWKIERSGERIVVRGPDGSGYAADRAGDSGIAESVLYMLAEALLSVPAAQA